MRLSCRRVCFGLTLILTFILLPSLAMAGNVIQVKNTTANTQTLSDLYVYDKDGKCDTILNANDPSDDVDIPKHKTRVYTAKFEVKSYVVSKRTGTEPYTEEETKAFKVTQLKPQPISFLVDPNHIMDLVLAIDVEAATFDTVPAGTILDFVDGTNVTLPGWFVGTAVDFETGEVTGPYTGQVEILSNPFECTLVETIPTLTEWGLIIFGVVLLGFITWVFLRRQKVAGVRI
jgi:hypothetical protein